MSRVPNRLKEHDKWIPDECNDNVEDITPQLVHGEVEKKLKEQE
jgi:hypothetical protein